MPVVFECLSGRRAILLYDETLSAFRDHVTLEGDIIFVAYVEGDADVFAPYVTL